MTMKMNERKTVELKNITDTWNIIEKYQVKGWTQKGCYGDILIPVEEFERVISNVKNRRYILNLKS